MTRGPGLWVAAASLAVLSTIACQAEDETPDQAATYASVECPADVRTAMTGSVECGRLTVPESRAGRDADRRISVFVTIVRAPGDDASDDPMLVVPGTAMHNYKGIAPLAERVERDVIIVDGRGTAHSQPTLDCLGVDAAVPDAWSRPTGDPSVAARLRDAVAECYDEFADAGIDVAAYDTTESAADLVDLRQALGLDRWNLISYGAPSRTALELLRQDPDHVRSVVMDSPEVIGADPRVTAAPATERAVRGVLTACEADPNCRAEHPDATELLDRALAGLADEPILLREVNGTGKAPLLDAGLLVRALRESLSNSAHLTPAFSVGGVPDLLADVVGRNTEVLPQEFAQLVDYGTPTCLGYRPTCAAFLDDYLGAELTRLCRDIAPFTTGPDPVGVPGFAELFDASPYWAFCEVWPVPAAEASVNAPPSWDGPALVVLGARDPYSDPDLVRQLSGLSSASYLVEPTKGHNAMTSACVLNRRNAWLDDPTPFTDNPCAEEEIAWTR